VRHAVISVAFHGIGPPPAELEPADQAYFIPRDLFLAVLDEIAGLPNVELSFDDGYASDIEMALPALVERSLSASFFPVAGRLGEPGFIDVTGIKALRAAGMTIGSHGMRHRPWRGLDANSMHEELSQARSVIAEASGTSVGTAACPFGSYDRQVLKALRSYGYTKVYTSDRRRARMGAWLQPRYSVTQNDTLQSVRRTVLAPAPYHDQLRRAAAARVKAWRLVD
jgi:peptidoglycan/xylan/chitin deacetylase (PgdA/CDA1 family)